MLTYTLTARVPRTYDGASTTFQAHDDADALRIVAEVMNPANDAHEVRDRHGLWDSITVDYCRTEGYYLQVIERRDVAEGDATMPSRW